MVYKIKGCRVTFERSEDAVESQKIRTKELLESLRITRAGMTALNHPALGEKFYSLVASSYPTWIQERVTSKIREIRSELRKTTPDIKVVIRHDYLGKWGKFSEADAHSIKHTVDTIIDNIRRDRRLRRQFSSEVRRVGEFRYNISGNMAKEGELRRAIEMRKAKLVFEPKRPLTMDRHIGIELEFISPHNREDIGLELTRAGVARYVQLKGDGSISTDDDNPYGHELVICVPESKRKEVVSAVNVVLSGCSARVNKSCGFHVHLDMRTREREKAFANLVCAQNTLYAMNPASRRDSTYCKKTPTKDFMTARNQSRYKGINAAAYNKYTTIEVRIHAGTIDERKILNWIDILIAVCDADSPFVRSPRTVESFCKGYKLGKELQGYIESRVALFSRQSPERVAI